MTRAEKAALKAYPDEMVTTCARGNKFRAGPLLRRGFQEGYEQAEKEFAEAIKTAEDHAYFAGSESMRENIISLIESRIGEILGDAQPAPILREELREIIKRIKQ